MAQLVQAEPEVVQGLRQKLLSEDIDLPSKYRVMYSLRNVAGEDANTALLEGRASRVGIVAAAGTMPARTHRGEPVRRALLVPCSAQRQIGAVSP
jgi:hypothetical protein